MQKFPPWMGGFRVGILLIILILSAWSNVSKPFSIPPPEAGGVTAASFDRSREIHWFSESRASGCVLTGFRTNDRTLVQERRFDFCPDFIEVAADGKWIDQEQAFVVYSEETPVASDSFGSTVIQTSPALRDRFEVRQNGRTVVSVPVRPPAEIEAFAATYIRDRLNCG